MSQTYANNAESIKQTVRQTQGEEAESIDALNDLVKQSYQDKLENFKEKWEGVEQIGSAVGQVAPTFRTARNIYSRFKSLGTNSKPSITEEPAVEADELPFPEVGIPKLGLTPSSVTNTPIPASRSGATGIAEIPQPAPRGFKIPAPRTKTVTEDPTPLVDDATLDDDPFQTYSGGKSLYSSFTRTPKTQLPQGGSTSTADDLAQETSQNVKSTVSDAVDAGSDALADAGTDIGSYLTADAISSSIPILGEAVSVIGSLATIGVGIGELLGHKTDTPQVHPVALSVPTNLTAKYSDSLPSADGVIQRASSSSVF